MTITHIQLAEPKNNRAAILKRMIETNGVSERDFSQNGFRSRITQIRKLVNVRTIQQDFTNAFGHSGKYNVHYLLEGEKEAAMEIYEKINK